MTAKPPKEAVDGIAADLTARQPPGANPIARGEVLRRAVAEYAARYEASAVIRPAAEVCAPPVRKARAARPPTPQDPYARALAREWVERLLNAPLRRPRRAKVAKS